jgi:peroxidase
MYTGEKLTKSLELSPLKEGYFHGYDDTLDAGVANSFASAAFRFYHSMVKVRYLRKKTGYLLFICGLN